MKTTGNFYHESDVLKYICRCVYDDYKICIIGLEVCLLLKTNKILKAFLIL